MRAFVGALSRAEIGRTFNQYAGNACLCERLRAYLDARASASILLVGEAAGYRGARVSGLPFTSERQVTGDPPGEASATVVHRVLAELGLSDHVLLWNLVPTHPHLPGKPDSNRRPMRAEIEAGRLFLQRLARGRRVIPVGRLAQAELGGSYVRHPSHGGERVFRASLLEWLDG